MISLLCEMSWNKKSSIPSDHWPGSRNNHPNGSQPPEDQSVCRSAANSSMVESERPIAYRLEASLPVFRHLSPRPNRNRTGCLLNGFLQPETSVRDRIRGLAEQRSLADAAGWDEINSPAQHRQNLPNGLPAACPLPGFRHWTEFRGI